MRRFAFPIVLAVIASCPMSSPARADDEPGFAETIERFVELSAQRRLAALKATPGVALAPFTTDGCSGGLSAGWTLAAQYLPGWAGTAGDHPPWEACCFDHDRVYHAAPGDTAEAGFDARRAADDAMRACVRAEGDRQKPALMRDYAMSPTAVDILFEGIAGAMYHAVRLGGAPCSPLPWRWGYGWPACREAAS